jgi:hypothetical protein
LEGEVFRRRHVPILVAFLTSLVVLGPALGRGVVLAYDLAWSPDPRWTPFSLGVGTPAPRAVPSDAVGVALGHLLGAGVAQAVVLLAILTLAGWGCARLALRLAPTSTLGAGAAVVAGVWNPFVLERLVVGQWTVLLGYALVPHLVLLAHRARTDARAARLLAAAVAFGGAGGANTLVLAGLAVVPVLLAPRPRWGPLGWTVAAAAGSSAVWAWPAVTAGVRSSAVGADVFAPRSDTPLGVGLSLLSGGGFWNTASHPAERTTPLLAVLATVLAVAGASAAVVAARRAGLGAVLVPAAVGLVAVLAAVTDPGGLWSGLVVSVPGGGVLRDAQKLVAPLVALSAAGLGVLVPVVGRRTAVGPAVSVLLAALPVVTLPGLAWGVQGRVAAVEVPDDVRAAASTLSRAPDASVGLLPWSQYRRYAWNGDRVSLTIAPRMVGARVLFDDGLPLAAGRVPGEDPAAARVTAAIAAGTDPVDALRAEGVRYVLLERRAGAAGPGTEVPVPSAARVLADTPNTLVLDLGAARPPKTSAVPLVAGWAATSLTWAGALLVLGHAVRDRKPREGGEAGLPTGTVRP